MRAGNAPKTARARQLRAADNEAESALWSDLRSRRLNGLKFVRQFPIGPYFADFACPERIWLWKWTEANLRRNRAIDFAMRR
jgi:very-short-patch-repair endonuclease